MNCSRRRIAPHRLRGVTLIEVLVTMVIVAVGLLGLAGMQVRGLSIQKDAHGRAIATQLATDIADRMRSNPVVFRAPTDANNFDQVYTSAAYAGAGVNCQVAVCNSAQQALFDRDNWIRRVQTALPGGWVRLIQDPVDRTVWRVTVMWTETGLRQNGAVRAGLAPATGIPNCPPESATPPEVECITVRVSP